MVLYEIFSQSIPFSDIADDVAVSSSIHEGKRPSIPSKLQLYIKMLMEFCWRHRAHNRPTFEGILQVDNSVTDPKQYANSTHVW